MEHIFTMSTDDFIRELETIFPEAYEANIEYLVCEKMPVDMSLSFLLLKVVYAFVKTRSKGEWKTETLIYYLYKIASTGEIFFCRQKGHLKKSKRLVCILEKTIRK